MADIKMNWVEAGEIKGEDTQLTVRQVYVWYLSSDLRLIVVSKDGENWQLPGGKPEPGEGINQTAIRELKEEAGVSAENMSDQLTFFGYYRVTKTEQDGSNSQFLQLRLYLKARVSSDQLILTASTEDQEQASEDIVMHVRAVTIDEAKQLIPWLAQSGEYQALHGEGVI